MLERQQFLLYLTDDTWTSPSSLKLAQEVGRALLHGMAILLVHESDASLGAAPFRTFFGETSGMQT